jgi:hypothetical protein
VVKSCHLCQQYNVTQHGYHPPRSHRVTAPWKDLQIDLCLSLPPTESTAALMVIYDLMSGFVVLCPIPNKEADTMVASLTRVFSDFGTPLMVQTDHGTEFNNEAVRNFFRNHHIEYRTSPVRQHHSQGGVERAIRSCYNIILKLCEGEVSRWPSKVHDTQAFMNARISSVHKTSPFELMFGRSSLIPTSVDFDIFDDDQRSWEDQRESYHQALPIIADKVNSARSKKIRVQSTKRIKRFKPGDWVYRRAPKEKKSDPNYAGPFEVLEMKDEGYYLSDTLGNRITEKISATELKRSPPPLQRTHQFKEIIGHCIFKGKRYYLISWEGNHPPTWEPPSVFDSSIWIQRYWKSGTTNEYDSHALPEHLRKS